MAHNQYDDNAVVLKHSLSTRIFHWGLILGFLPAALTGIIIWLKLGSEDFVGLAMKIHIVGAWILSISCVYFFLFCYKRVVAFWRTAFNCTADDIKWMSVSGGYPHKIFLGKTIPVPPMGKMNSGQKMLGIMVFFGTLVVIVSGWLLYAFLPMVPKEIAHYADLLHLFVGLFLTLAICFGHIVLSIYNWGECVCMFGDGTMKVSEAAHHNELWVKNEIEPVKK
jgi:formate dehydrogenase subunit gamma